MSDINKPCEPSLPPEDKSPTKNARKRSGSHSPERPSKVTKVRPSDIASHYNARPEQGQEARRSSPIIHLRKFNNWVKSVLINMHTPPRATILDMGCGKGGDLLKWRRARVSRVVMADIASESLEQAKERYRSMKPPPFEAEFHCLDCYEKDLVPERPVAFDIVSLQFCMHYAFDNEDRARRMLKNVTRYLKPGGHFIGTIPDSSHLVRRVKEAPELSFGNSIYSIRFNRKRDLSHFGEQYHFQLRDAVDCPEYLVHFPSFEKLAEEFGLKLLGKSGFRKFCDDKLRDPQWSKLYKRMGVDNGEGGISTEEWEAIGLYMAFAFKMTESAKPNSNTATTADPSE